MKLLIAEDEEFNQIVLKDMLQILFENLDIKVVSNGLDALECIKEGWPDVVLSDVDMPKMRGDELVKIVRTEMGLMDLPMLCITAFAISGDKELLLENGFDAYVSKPIDMNDLQKTMGKYLQGE